MYKNRNKKAKKKENYTTRSTNKCVIYCDDICTWKRWCTNRITLWPCLFYATAHTSPPSSSSMNAHTTEETAAWILLIIHTTRRCIRDNRIKLTITMERKKWNKWEWQPISFIRSFVMVPSCHQHLSFMVEYQFIIFYKESEICV